MGSAGSSGTAAAPGSASASAAHDRVAASLRNQGNTCFLNADPAVLATSAAELVALRWLYMGARLAAPLHRSSAAQTLRSLLAAAGCWLRPSLLRFFLG